MNELNYILVQHCDGNFSPWCLIKFIPYIFILKKFDPKMIKFWCKCVIIRQVNILHLNFVVRITSLGQTLFLELVWQPLMRFTFRNHLRSHPPTIKTPPPVYLALKSRHLSISQCYLYSHVSNCRGSNN